MPTERFFRLPDKKKEAVRTAAANEFARALPEEASINRIIHDAEISRGSFYTYFQDKEDLLCWLVGDVIDRNLKYYIQRLKENNSDIWDVFEHVLENSILQVTSEGLNGLFANLIKSNSFSELFQRKMDEEKEITAVNQKFYDSMYEHLDRKLCPASREEFYSLMEMQMMVQMTALKRLFQMGLSREQVEAYYRGMIRILRYGICGKTDGN